MAEGWVSTGRGKAVSGRLSKNTVPELALRRALHAAVRTSGCIAGWLKAAPLTQVLPAR